mmetsp:Transcript_19311/g.53710  ORF Transcript_19311/g.53710 Transcript_19311/m.53710 type:complete len:367 (-) Transcript_19311:114-1214(-)|eukprot:CAMPEP_0198118408 /NCGR_PEP_ID=MMETSP1442-20131203/21570_1 /TAXON_ID= /ORGANISM="Craspedostauros australis, Strain CCMP3328" /LENGTH=366 /DNA_ID=CAMNT_0043776661 /DNA_START=185 /DNA_END=1285 /DNA_ORIENTATION=+
MTLKNRQTVLVTGGCGYIGSHALTTLLDQDYNVVVVDNLSNATDAALDRVAQVCKIPQEERSERIVFHNVDVCDRAELRKVMEASPTFTACIHFAGLKAVGDSTSMPLLYYHNNLYGTLVLLELLDEFGCRCIVFSSSATVYGEPKTMPITEQFPAGQDITNAYGRTKYFVEEILKDFYNSKTLKGKSTDWSVILLRYFNPIGAHESGLIGEDPNGIPNNLMPYLAQVACGRREFLTVFGNDYSTPDGTGVRDYLHVMDLVEGHVQAIQHAQKQTGGLYTYNLGTGHGVSVLGLLKSMEKACGHELKYKLGERRPGDIAISYSDASLAANEMGWKAKRTFDQMCEDVWRWQSNNPNGYRSASELEK